MLRFYSHKKSIFECKIKLEGAEVKEATPKLVLRDGSISHTFEGEIDVLGKCVVTVPPLNNMKKGKGEAVLEVRLDDVVFEPYKTKYEIVKQDLVVSEAKVVSDEPDEKPGGTFVEGVDHSDKLLALKLINTYRNLDKKNKKTVKEYVEYKYQPSKEAMTWARRVYSNIKSFSARIAMYEMDLIGKETKNKKRIVL